MAVMVWGRVMVGKSGDDGVRKGGGRERW